MRSFAFAPSHTVLTGLTTHPVAPAEPDARVVKFSPHYKLVFSLLNQDSSAEGAILDWDVHSLLSCAYLSVSVLSPARLTRSPLAAHIRPFLSSFSPLHNFTIESQVQYFAPLSVELHEDEEKQGTYVEEDDLRAFVNSAEWNLGALFPSSFALLFPDFFCPVASGDTLDPVLHFLLYIPSPQNRPLRILTAGALSFPAVRAFDT